MVDSKLEFRYNLNIFSSRITVVCIWVSGPIAMRPHTIHHHLYVYTHTVHNVLHWIVLCFFMIVGRIYQLLSEEPTKILRTATIERMLIQ